MRRLCTGAAVAAIALLIASASPASAQSPAGQVVVVHGLRGLTADVYLDAELVLEGFQPERSTDPLQVPAGTHTVEVREANAAATTEPVISSDLEVQAGSNNSMVVHLSPEGEPTATLFANDTASLPGGSSRVVVRHTAAASAVDVSLGTEAVATNLRNPRESVRDIAARSYNLEVRSAGTADVLAPPEQVTFADGTANFMYLIGSAEEGTLGWLAQTVTGLQSAPSRVSTGNSGLVGPSTGGAPGFLVAGTVAALVVAVAVTLRSGPGRPIRG